MSATDTVQAWLALEHEAVWTYSTIAARVDAVSEAARASFGRHRSSRDALVARLEVDGVEPVGAQLAYALPDLSSAANASAAAVALEAKIATTCLTLVGETTGRRRRSAVTALTTAALAQLTWGAPPQAFPALP